MTFWPWLIFAIAIGGCVGSFLNVVILRLPAGESLVTPPSACPKCGHRLAWFENVPVISWLALRGKCRKCKAPISAQYPLIELLTALLFAGLFLWYYLSGFRPMLALFGLGPTWPVLAMHLILLAGLLAATVIDIRCYIIPIVIPWCITVLVLIIYPGAAGLGVMPAVLHRPRLPVVEHIVPIASAPGIGAAIGGTLGLVIALGLMRFGLLPRSFDDVDAHPPADHEADAPLTDPEQMIAHPHPRREAAKEALFLALPIAGFMLGFVLAIQPIESLRELPYPLAAHVLGGVVLGYLVGGGLVWVTRVLGTLGFGKEAMGLGDVHLLAAIGAVMGGFDAVFVFFIAPFVGLAAVMVEMLLSAMKKKPPRVIPFGPSLAAAALVMMLFRREILTFILPG